MPKFEVYIRNFFRIQNLNYCDYQPVPADLAQWFILHRTINYKSDVAIYYILDLGSSIMRLHQLYWVNSLLLDKVFSNFFYFLVLLRSFFML